MSTLAPPAPDSATNPAGALLLFGANFGLDMVHLQAVAGGKIAAHHVAAA